MPNPTLRLALIGLILIALAVLAWPLDSMATAGAPDPADSDGARLFQEKIAPVLKAECFRCHSAEAEKLRGGLRLDARRRFWKAATPALRSSPARAARAS